ncbi:hypothetical protein GEMRC1_000315 [Eukaryota sp. GEM-RC1]
MGSDKQVSERSVYPGYTFNNIIDVNKVINDFSQEDLRGCSIKVHHSRPRNGLMQTSLIIENIPQTLTIEIFTHKCQMFGNVRSLHLETTSKDSMVIGFCDFFSNQEAKSALVQLQNEDWGAGLLRVKFKEHSSKKSIDSPIVDDPFTATRSPSASRDASRDPSQTMDNISNPDIVSSSRLNVSDQTPSTTKFKHSNLKSNLGQIYITGLHPNIDGKRLEELFSPFGKIMSGMVNTDDQGKCKGRAFIQFDTPQSVIKAIDAMHGKEVGSSKDPDSTSPISVHFFHPPTPRFRLVNGIPAQLTVTVTRLPIDLTNEQFLEILSPFGEIKSHRLITIKSRNQKAGIASFANVEQAINAVQELHLSCAFGKVPIAIRFLQPEQLAAAVLKKEYNRTCTELQEASKHKTLWVGSLPPSTTDDSLYQMFYPFGAVTSAIVMKTVTGESRRFGHVCFEKSEEANAALLEMNEKLIPGTNDRLQVCRFRSEQERKELEYKILDQQRVKRVRAPYLRSNTVS